MGLYQGQLGMALGVSGAVISNWEKGLNKPDADKLVRLCEVLNVPIAYLLDCWTGGKPVFPWMNGLASKNTVFWTSTVRKS